MVEAEPLDSAPTIEEAPAAEQAVLPEEAWNTLASTLNLAGPQSPALDGFGNADVQSNVGCMENVAGFGLNCTANDIGIANATNITILDDGCAYPGDTVTFKADFEVLLTAQARYDVGLWFATDGDPNGDGAKTGSCTAATPAYAPDPPWLDLDQLVDGQADDTCGDIDSTHNPLHPSVTLTVACVDDDANGKLDLPNCTSWNQPGSNELCTSPVQAFPGTGSKCNCDTGFNVDIPVPGQIIVDKVTSPSGDPTTFNFTLTGGPSNVSIPFSLTDASTPFKSTNLMGGTYSVVEGANPSYATTAICSDGSPANAIALAPGEIVTCTFTNTLQTGTLIVEKNLINNNSGTKTCADFSYKVDGGANIPFEADCSNSVTVLAGSHSVVEVGVPIDGYTTTYNNCSNVSVPAGGTATCTITNDDVAMPGMTVEKSSATTELTTPSTVIYDYLVTNTGNTTLTGIALSDNNDNNDMVCESDTLAKGESMTCTATHTFTQAELDAGGTIDNTVTADSNETDPIYDSLSIPIQQNAAINVDKSSTTTLIENAGQVVPYTFFVTNAGNVTLTGIAVTDPMCAAAPTFVSGDTNTDSMLQVGETWTYTCSHTVTQAEIDQGGSLSNTVTADSNESGPATDTLDIPIEQSNAIIVVKASTTEEIFEAGQVVPYTFTVDNNGNTTLTGIVVTDPMCDAAPKYVSGDDGDGMLQVNETWLYTCSHTVTQAEIDTKGGGDGDLDNTVTADSNESEPDTDDHAIPIDYYPFLVVEKSSTTTSLSAPGTVSYSYLVTNTGNVTLTGIVLSDNNDEEDMVCPADTLAPGASMTCTATHNFTQDELDTLDSLDNTVSAASNEAPDATDSLSIPITKSSAIIVVKASTTVEIVAAGQVVPYTFTVDNDGTTTLTGITVTDAMCDAAPALVTGGDLDTDNELDVDETWTYTCSHTVTQAEMDAGGNLSNTVTADSNESEPDTASHDIPIVRTAEINVEKSSTTTEITAAGQVVLYTFVVTNADHVTLTGIVVSDGKCDDDPVLLSGDTNADNKLQIDETWTYTCSHTVTQAEVDAGGYLHNIVMVTSNESGPDMAQLDIPVTKSPAFTIDKTATPTTYDSVGDVINYSYLVTNSGNVTLYNISVVDDKATVSCADTSDGLAPGGTVTCTASYTITQADVDSGSVTNTAYASDGTTQSPNDSETVTADKKPALSIDKTATPATYAAVGEVISYSYVVTNSGNVTLYNISVVDDKATVTCPAGAATMVPGASVTCTASYTIAQADLDAGSVTNSAYATDGTTQSTPDTETVTATQTAALTLDKTATPTEYDEVGDVISYSYLLTNSGNVTLSGPFTVDDTKVTVACPSTPAVLAPLASTTCTASYIITQADLDYGSVLNSATGHAFFGETPVDSNPDTQTVYAVPMPALAIDKTAEPATYDSVGDVISYSYLVTNTGNITLHQVTVVDDKATVTCPDTQTEPLGPQGSITCTASYTITQADLDAGSVTNTAYAKDGNTTSQPDSETVTAVPMPALSVVKTATPATYDAVGDVISYSYLVTNTGNITLFGITVVDDKATVTCPPEAASLAPLATVTCTASYTITQADLDGGSVTNTAYATDGTTQSPPDSETVTADKKPALTIVKTASPATYAAVGEVISYSYLVTNSGNVTLYNITVEDDKANVDCPDTSAGLAPFGQITCTASYTITQADLDAGSVTNTAYATDGTTQSPPDSETVNAVQSPAISLAKSAYPTTYDAAGDEITYSYVITNIGNVTLPGPFSVADDKAIVTCDAAPAGGVAPQGTLLCTATYMITQLDVDAGFVTNTATASTTFDNQNVTSEPASATVNAIQNPAIEVLKSGTFGAGADGYANVGELISYEFVVSNVGNVTLTGITVTDPKVSPIACPETTLAVGESMTCTGTYAVTQTDIDAGLVYNLATADSTQSGPDTDEETVTLPQNPAITLVKTGTFDAGTDGYANVGEVISYEFLVTNTGNVTLTGITVTDPKVDPISCPADTLLVSEIMTCTGSYAVTQADIDAGFVYNLATADSNESEPDDGDNNEPLPQNPAISLVKTGTFGAGADGYANVGEIISYEFLVTNTGNVTLTGITVTDPKVSTIDCPVTTLAVGASMTCTGTYAVTQADIDAGSVYNMATADSTQSESDTDDETVTLPQNPAISLTKSAAPTTYDSVGDVITYSYTITNTGNVTLVGPFVVADNKATVTCSAAPVGGLIPGASLTCSATYTISQADLDAGLVTNTAKASTTYNTDTIYSNEAQATVTAVQSPAITLTKTANPTLYDAAGDVITYTMVAKNTGNVTLHDVSITDPMLGALTCTPNQPATLAPNATLTCTGTYTIQAADLTLFSITNTATVNGKGPQDQPVTATATATIYRQTGALLPTQTTCQMYAGGPSMWPTMYDAFMYQAKGNKISSVSPGVIFYYNTITAPAASFTLSVTQTNSLNWKPMLIQDLGQAILYTSNCTKAAGVTVTTMNNPYTVNFTVTGATPGAIYYIGIKYSPRNLVGQAVTKNATSIYYFSTTGYTGSEASIPVKPKK